MCKESDRCPDSMESCGATDGSRCKYKGSLPDQAMSDKPELKGYVLEGGATLNAGHFHEIIDRGNLICGMIDDYLIERPGMTVEMNKKCEAAQQLLGEVTNLSCAEQDRIFGADLAKPSGRTAKRVYYAGNRTSNIFFESKKDALIYQSSAGSACGIDVWPVDIVPSHIPMEPEAKSSEWNERKANAFDWFVKEMMDGELEILMEKGGYKTPLEAIEKAMIAPTRETP